MKRLLITLFFVAISLYANGQKRLQYMVKAPKIYSDELLFGEPIDKGTSIYLDFFALDMPQNDNQLSHLDKISKRYGSIINIVVITRDDIDKVREFFSSKDIDYSVLHDKEGQTFKKFGVKFLPFSVVIDSKGNFIWQGKNSDVTDDVIMGAL